MAALPYIQLYVADYLADTQHLTTEEHGAYMLLIFSYWQTGKPLRIDRLATVARLSNERWANVEETLREFFHVVGTHWHHFRIEADLEAVNSKSSKASDAGKASAKARALKKQQESNERSTDVETNAEETYQRNGNHTDTDTDTTKPLSPDGDESGKKISYAAIAELYNRVCGDVLPRCVALNAKRKNNIRNLCSLTINGDKPFRDLDFWEGYFNDCLTNKHWTGQNDRGWRADLEFLTRQEVALKALEAA